jgi:hypothetical protein
MKNLRRLSVALVFTLALTLPAFAGEMDTGRTSPPPSQPSQTATAKGEIETTVTGQEETGSSEATAADSATKLALNLLQSVLTLF